MAIPTTRTKESAGILIDTNQCNGCGLCVSVCKDFSLAIVNRKVETSDKSVFGCIGCGHCMAICPAGAIKISGRELSPGDLFDLPGKDTVPDYRQLLSLLQHRRSIREFTERKIEPWAIEKILEAAVFAPMGLPPSDVNVLVINGREKTRAFAKDYSVYLKGLRYMTSQWFLALMRPFWGRENDELFRGFIDPMFRVFIDDMERGENYITYDAPLLIYFYGSPYSDPADPIVAATYAMLAAGAMGLGTCMLGGILPMIQSGRKAKAFRQSHGIKYKSREGLFLAIGYPAVTFRKGIRRTFASVEMT